MVTTYHCVDSVYRAWITKHFHFVRLIWHLRGWASRSGADGIRDVVSARTANTGHDCPCPPSVSLLPLNQVPSHGQWEMGTLAVTYMRIMVGTQP